VLIETNRVIRPAKYRVKEVIIAPEDQVKRFDTTTGTAIAVESSADRTVIVGQEADEDVLDNTEIDQTFPVIRVPNNDVQEQFIDSDMDENMMEETEG